MHPYRYIALTALTIANIIDVYATSVIVGTDLDKELNPIARAIISSFGYEGLLMMKLFLIGAMWIAMLQYPKISNYSSVMVFSCTGIYVVVAWLQLIMINM